MIKTLNEYALQTVPRRENITTLGARQNAGYEQKAVIQRTPLIDSQRPKRASERPIPIGRLLQRSCRSLHMIDHDSDFSVFNLTS